MSQPASVYRRRRAAAAAVAAALLLAIVVALRSCGGADDGAGDAASAVGAAPVPRRAQLPGGGRTIFPARRVVAFYGAPQSDRLGILGIGDVDGAAMKLRRVARAYERRTRPVLPAFELISTIANAHPGDDDLYRTHQPPETIDRYLAAARRAKALLVLDIQPGRGDFLSEAQRLQRWLLQPDVGLALDPEWHVGADAVPGQMIGSVTAEEVNAVSTYLSNLVGKHDLPDKLFVVHQFTQGMIVDKERVARPPGLAVTMNVDGFGNRANKISKYKAFTSEATRFHDGFKLFYEEDTELMSPRDVLALGPPPDLIVYE
ncbi:MAG TPA: hypothetical protein VGO80_03190 [Solirubrobacteraceae bacterium]|jgi:hypothetical protein|nr:hypothetical protein [Solirubrobacteraceae bacterium]